MNCSKLTIFLINVNDNLKNTGISPALGKIQKKHFVYMNKVFF